MPAAARRPPSEAIRAQAMMSDPEQRHRERLLAIARDSDWMMAALRAARGLGLARWCIGAGAVRNLVWDHLHGHQQPSPLRDIDLAFFDPEDLTPGRDAALQARLVAQLPGPAWEVTNQAGVHLWFESCFGHAVEPLRSLEDALASWPETATAVGLCLHQDERLELIAPLGLDDLMGMVVRRNPRRVSPAEYRRRCASKAYAARWPRVRVIEERP